MKAARATREAWLDAMTAALRPKFKDAGYPIPAKVHVSCAFPATGGTARKNRRIGECWPASSSESGHAEIFISPTLSNPVAVGGVLVHELLHAAIEPMFPDKHVGHGPAFKAAMGPLGMNGKATATTESAELKRELTAIAKSLGKYPHSSLKVSRAGKVQTTRLIKVECGGCGYVVRTTAKWIETGLPTCCCGDEMELAS
jgi:hypothetical protein